MGTIAWVLWASRRTGGDMKATIPSLPSHTPPERDARARVRRASRIPQNRDVGSAVALGSPMARRLMSLSLTCTSAKQPLVQKQQTGACSNAT